jgi:ACS family glucarate transporter-like MFS transporter
MRPTHVRYYVLVALCVAGLIAYMDRGCIAVAEAQIREDLTISLENMSILLEAFFLTYSVLQVPGAALVKRWGPRLALPAFATVWSAATGLCGLAFGYPDLLVYRLCMGAAEAGIFPGATTALGRWFPSTRRAWVCGLLLAFMGIGGAVGGSLSGRIIQHLSWRWMFLLYAVPGVVWSLGFLWWFRDSPGAHRGVNAAERALIEDGDVAPATAEDKHPRDSVPWKAILTSGALWLLAFQQFFRSLGLGLFQSYYPTFLVNARGANLIDSGDYTGSAFIAVVLGSVLGGMIADWILVRTGSRALSRKGVGLVSTFSAAVVVLAAFFVHSLWLTALLVAVSVLLLSLSNSCGYALTIDMGGKYVALVFAIVNSMANLGYVVFPSLATELRKQFNGDWNVVLLIVVGANLAAAACWVFFNPYARITGEADDAQPMPNS